MTMDPVCKRLLSLVRASNPTRLVKADTGLSKSIIYDLQKRALSRGYDPSKDRKILIAYVEDALKVSRPKKCTLEVEEAVIKIILKNLTYKSFLHKRRSKNG